MNEQIRQQLVAYAAAYETEDFLTADPSRFMHQVSETPDQELMAFIASCFSYGNRRLFLPKLQWILDQSRHKPDKWLRTEAYKVVVADSGENFYRLQTWHHLRQLLEALAQLIMEEGSLGRYGTRSFKSADRLLPTLGHRPIGSEKYEVTVQTTMYVPTMDGA